jgi:hypothetical protein
MNPSCTVVIHTPQELNHSSYIQTGLFELEQKGLIVVKVQMSIKKNLGFLTVTKDGVISKRERAHSKTSFYTLIDHTTNKKITFAADLYDHAEHFSETALNNCDFYFKRNYEQKFVSVLNNTYSNKVYPLGLTFRVCSNHVKSSGLFKIGVLLSNLFLNLKIDRRFFKRVRLAYISNVKHIQKTKENRKIERFENFKKEFKTNSIFFQTRCFLHENDQDLKQIHSQRYHLIKLLRTHFPKEFLGGFIPSKIAIEKYNDALTNVPTAPEAYLDAMKKAKIVIYTRGLANSPAWKMAEYLSQAKVIIAEPLTAELPVPLKEGKELLYFNNDTELIEKIKRVLEDKALATHLSKNARAYFEKHVHPVQNTKRILELMLKKPPV